MKEPIRWTVRSRDIKYYISTQKIHVHQITEGANLPWEARTMKAVWPFDHVTNVGSRDNLRNLYFHFQKSYGH